MSFPLHDRDSNICFSICLAHFLNPHCPDQELTRIANNIHTDLGYRTQVKIAFHDISKFEMALDVKIVIFHRSCSGKLEVYKNTDEVHQNTVHLYLHDDHYYMIKNLKPFLGYSYVCDYCYQGFKDRNLHYCKFTCNSLSAACTLRNGYSVRTAQDIADLTSVTKRINNRKVMD